VEEEQEEEGNRCHPMRWDLERQLLSVKELVKEYWHMGGLSQKLLGRRVDG
jgi:hypothetical protein